MAIYEIDPRPFEVALRRAHLPDWVVPSPSVGLVDDVWSGEAALMVTVVVRHGRESVLTDGRRLADLRRQIHATLNDAGLSAWPHVSFVSEDELDAA